MKNVGISPAMEGLGNWTTRMTRTFAELEQDPEMVRTLEFVSSIIWLKLLVKLVF